MNKGFDVHWYRRVFHTFGATFLVYYLLPDIYIVNIAKILLSISLVGFVAVFEILRIKGRIKSKQFIGLRGYEENRFGSYLFFGIGLLILLLFFPQQIAIPCILCACFADPIIGELRSRFSKKNVFIIGFLVCMSFFIVTWIKADMWLMLTVGFIGGFGAIVGETWKFWWLDDDFMIQMLPAVLLLAFWLTLSYLGISLPDVFIHPGIWPW